MRDAQARRLACAGSPCLSCRLYSSSRIAAKGVGMPSAYSVTPSMWSVWTDFAAKGTLTDFPLRRMSERGV